MMLQLKRKIHMTRLDWLVAALGLLLTLTCPFGAQMWPVSLVALFKWSGCLLLTAALSYQLLHKDSLALNCLALKTGLSFLAVYGVLLAFGVHEVRRLHACQALVYACVVWFVGVWLRSPAREA